jgi:hypothetical protein
LLPFHDDDDIPTGPPGEPVVHSSWGVVSVKMNGEPAR